MSLLRRRRWPPLRRTVVFFCFTTYSVVRQNLDLPSRASAPLILIATACSLALLPTGASAGCHIQGDLPAGGTLQLVFAGAASEFHVPEEVLLAVSYNVSRWEWHAGPSTSGGYGVMHLIDIGQPPPSGVPALPAAATLLGSSDE